MDCDGSWVTDLLSKLTPKPDRDPNPNPNPDPDPDRDHEPLSISREDFIRGIFLIENPAPYDLDFDLGPDETLESKTQLLRDVVSYGAQYLYNKELPDLTSEEFDHIRTYIKGLGFDATDRHDIKFIQLPLRAL